MHLAREVRARRVTVESSMVGVGASVVRPPLSLASDWQPAFTFAVPPARFAT